MRTKQIFENYSINCRFSKIMFSERSSCSQRSPVEICKKSYNVWFLMLYNVCFLIFFASELFGKQLPKKRFLPPCLLKGCKVCIDFRDVREYWSAYFTVLVFEIFAFYGFCFGLGYFWTKITALCCKCMIFENFLSISNTTKLQLVYKD